MNIEIEYLSKCPVCRGDSSSAEHLLNSTVSAYGGELYYSIEICRNCGVMFSRERSAFPDVYKVDNDPEKDHGRHCSPLKPLSAETVTGYHVKSQQAEEIVSLLPADRMGYYGEIGASDGSLFRIVREKCNINGLRIHATLVESSGAASLCAQFSGCQVYSQFWEDVRWKMDGSMFDVFVLSHCLEHFTNPSQLLYIIHRLLIDDGLLFVEVPDASRYDYSISYPLGYFHVLNFNLINLIWFVESCGFRVIDVVQREFSPALRVIASKAEKTAGRPPTTAYLWSKGIFKQWQTRRASYLVALRDVLGEKLSESLLIFGTGAHTKSIIDAFPKWLTDEKCIFVDSNKNITSFCGRPVLSFEEIDWGNYEGKIVISSYAFQEEMKKMLLSAGCNDLNIITLYDEVFSYS